MNQLVIAEKPSVAKTIAAVLGVKKREDGYLTGNGYIVSWCFGHLAELADADAYHEKYAKWRYDTLPILPSPWQYTVSRDKKRQLDLLCTLMKRGDVGEIVNACDAGREGELIFRTVYNLAGCTKPTKRLWINSMEDAAILEGFANLRDGAGYDHLYEAALCRSKADWLVGINATRLFSVLYHRTLNVGRVVSPTLALLVQREAEIAAFQPESYYSVNLDVGAFTVSGEKLANKADADQAAADCRGQQAHVVSVERREKTEKAPALYDLTTLQRDANRLLGYTAQQTLEYCQDLYERKLSTYPRTDSRFLTDDMEASVPAVVLCAAGILDVNAPMAHAAQVCDSGKVSDHHAILPTMAAGEADLTGLPAGEQELLKLICRQVLMAVSEPCRHTETVAVLECGGYPFTAKGKTVTCLGWRAYLSQDQKDPMLPELNEAEAFTPREVHVKEGKTTPPKHFTEDTLLASMETAGVQDMPEDAERKGLGTPATRAGVLEKLVSAGLVERRKSKKAVSLIPAQVGTALITVLPEQLQSPLLTAEWEQKLKQVERGELAPEDFLTEISAMVTELVKGYTVVPGAEVLFPSDKPVVGKCPRCGSAVTENKRGYFCNRYDCHFAIWRDNRYLAAKKVALTRKLISELLATGRTYVSGIYSEKTGKPYSAFICLEDDGTRSSFKLDFTRP